MIDITEVKVGDRVRVTRSNGDEATFTVTLVHPDSLESQANVFSKREWATIEVLEPQPTPGYYQYAVSGLYFFSEAGTWSDVTRGYQPTNYPAALFKSGELVPLVRSAS